MSWDIRGSLATLTSCCFDDRLRITGGKQKRKEKLVRKNEIRTKTWIYRTLVQFEVLLNFRVSELLSWITYRRNFKKITRKSIYFANKYLEFTGILNVYESPIHLIETFSSVRRTDRLRFLAIPASVPFLLFVNDLLVLSVSFYLCLVLLPEKGKTSNGFSSPWRAARLVLKGKKIFFGARIVDRAVRLKSE